MFDKESREIDVLGITMIRSVLIIIFLLASNLALSASNYSQLEAMNCVEARSYTKDVGSNIKEVRELERIDGACKKFYKLNKKNNLNSGELAELREKFVLCGKEIFFKMASLKTDFGMPEKLTHALIDSFPEYTGKKLEKLGFLVDDSIKEEKWPLGFVNVKKSKPFSFKSITSGKVQQVSCAACHVAKLPDNRIAVGAPNQKLDLGLFNALGAYTFWRMDGSSESNQRWDENLVKFYQSLDIKLKSRNKDNMISNIDYIKNLKLQDVFYRLLGEGVVPVENQRTYLKGGPGVYALMSPMLNVPGKEYYVTPPQIWGLEDFTKRNNKESKNTLGFINEVFSLEEFIEQAIILSTHSKKYVKKKNISPLAKYISCLQAPVNNEMIKKEQFDEGAKIFNSSCIGCHSNKNGNGQSIYLPESVNSPEIYFNLLDNLKLEDRQSKKIMKIFDQLGITINVPKGIAPRRLDGIWVKDKLMHNGQVNGLDHLFCLNNMKREDTEMSNPLLSGTHSDLCNNYSLNEKLALKEYLKHFKVRSVDEN